MLTYMPKLIIDVPVSLEPVKEFANKLLLALYRITTKCVFSTQKQRVVVALPFKKKRLSFLLKPSS